MSMIMRVRVWRGGRRVVKWRRRLRCSSASPEKLWAVGPLRPEVSARVDQLVTEVRDVERQMGAKEEGRRRHRRVKTIVTRRVWWWQRIRWKILCPEWLLCMALAEVRRCQAWWRDVRVRMLLRRCRGKRWCLDWWRRQEDHAGLQAAS
jgi:hypothetical protein